MEGTSGKLKMEEDAGKEKIVSGNVSPSSMMDLKKAINDSKMAIHLFCGNNFKDCSELFRSSCRTSMYHALGNASYLFMEAVMTFDQVCIQKAIEETDRTIKLCDSFRRKHSYIGAIKKLMNIGETSHYSSEEIHAELLFAESQSLKSILVFIDERSNTFAGFIKSGLKLRSAFNSYKDCELLLNHLETNHLNNDIHFESGVRIGVGCFNLIISHLPSKIIRLLELVGFSGDKDVGMTEIMNCFNVTDGLRNIGSIMVLLIYNLIMIYFLGNNDGDLELCDHILETQLREYPMSAVFLFFKGRLEFLKGHVEESNNWHIKSWQAQMYWPQLHHFCFWEIMWNYVVLQDWNQAEKFSGYLLENSKWSRTIFCYQKASIMLMRHTELTDEEKNEIDVLMRNTIKFKQRVAGRSLPIEKFCIKKSNRYRIQNRKLVLPVYELLFVWNMFKPLRKVRNLCLSIYDSVVKERERLSADPDETKSPFAVDNEALLLFLESVCLTNMNRYSEAETLLKTVIALEKRIKDDAYIVPYSYIELANIHIIRGENSSGIHILEEVRSSFTGYSLENRLHFQIHSTLLELKK